MIGASSELSLSCISLSGGFNTVTLLLFAVGWDCLKALAAKQRVGVSQAVILDVIYIFTVFSEIS